MLLQLTEPESFAVGIDLGTTHSLVAFSEKEKTRLLTGLVPSVIDSIASFKRFMPSPKENIQGETPLMLSSKLLKHLKALAEEELGHSISQAVITVPAHFDDTARQATKEAAILAGFNVLRLINEPTAAAFAYGVHEKKEGLYLVYDFGGGTFDVSLLQMTKGVFQVLRTNGDLYLGGDDIDHVIQSHFSTKNLSEARAIKEKGGPQINDLAQPFIEKTMSLCEEVLLGIEESLQGILLVGGSSRLEGVAKSLEERFHLKPLCTQNPDHVVAIGAALQAEALTKGSDYLLLDVTPLSLGIETMGGIVEKIIPRNTPIPISASEEFTTFQDNQSAIKIHIMQGESDFVEGCRSLAELTLREIPPMPASIPRLEVTFHVDADGILSVFAKETRTGIEQAIEVNPKYGLTEQEIRELLKTDSKDFQKRLLIELRLKADQLLRYAKQLNENTLENHIIILEEKIKNTDFHEIKQAMDVLSESLKPLVEKRMTESLRQL